MNNVPAMRCEQFYAKHWKKRYRFWHKVINRSRFQKELLTNIIVEPGKSRMKILDLGCGEGNEITAALSRLKHIDFTITANDTSEEALKIYKKANSKCVVKCMKCSLEVVPELLENEKFDFILFSHSLYGISLDGLFQRYIKLLESDGKMLIFLESSKSEMVKLRQMFWKRLYNVEFDENTAEDVSAALKKMEIKQRIYEVGYCLDLEKLESLYKNGLVKFVIPFALRNTKLPPNILLAAKEYLLSVVAEGKISCGACGIVAKH